MPSLKDTIKREFPSANSFMLCHFANIPNKKPDVWKAFLVCSQLPEDVARSIVAYRDSGNPEIRLTERSNVNGYFSPRTPQIIWIHRKLFEAHHSGMQGSEILLESTILHELVHLGNFLSRYALDARKLKTITKPDGSKAGGYVDFRGKPREIGKLFEKAAYDEDINMKNMRKFAIGNCGTCHM